MKGTIYKTSGYWRNMDLIDGNLSHMETIVSIIDCYQQIDGPNITLPYVTSVLFHLISNTGLIVRWNRPGNYLMIRFLHPFPKKLSHQ